MCACEQYIITLIRYCEYEYKLFGKLSCFTSRNPMLIHLHYWPEYAGLLRARQNSSCVVYIIGQNTSDYFVHARTRRVLFTLLARIRRITSCTPELVVCYLHYWPEYAGLLRARQNSSCVIYIIGQNTPDYFVHARTRRELLFYKDVFYHILSVY